MEGVDEKLEEVEGGVERELVELFPDSAFDSLFSQLKASMMEDRERRRLDLIAESERLCSIWEEEGKGIDIEDGRCVLVEYSSLECEDSPAISALSSIIESFLFTLSSLSLAIDHRNYSAIESCLRKRPFVESCDDKLISRGRSVMREIEVEREELEEEERRKEQEEKLKQSLIRQQSEKQEKLKIYLSVVNESIPLIQSSKFGEMFEKLVEKLSISLPNLSFPLLPIIQEIRRSLILTSKGNDSIYSHIAKGVVWCVMEVLKRISEEEEEVVVRIGVTLEMILKGVSDKGKRRELILFSRYLIQESFSLFEESDFPPMKVGGFYGMLCCLPNSLVFSLSEGWSFLFTLSTNASKSQDSHFHSQMLVSFLSSTHKNLSQRFPEFHPFISSLLPSLSTSIQEKISAIVQPSSPQLFTPPIHLSTSTLSKQLLAEDYVRAEEVWSGEEWMKGVETKEVRATVRRRVNNVDATQEKALEVADDLTAFLEELKTQGDEEMFQFALFYLAHTTLNTVQGSNLQCQSLGRFLAVLCSNFPPLVGLVEGFLYHYCLPTVPYDPSYDPAEWVPTKKKKKNQLKQMKERLRMKAYESWEEYLGRMKNMLSLFLHWRASLGQSKLVWGWLTSFLNSTSLHPTITSHLPLLFIFLEGLGDWFLVKFGPLGTHLLVTMRKEVVESEKVGEEVRDDQFRICQWMDEHNVGLS